MKKKVLARYWAVKNDSSELFKEVVLGHMMSQYGEHWIGNDPHAYYGFDGNSQFRGTAVKRDLHHFINPVKVYTIEEFCRLTGQRFKPCLKREDFVYVSNINNEVSNLPKKIFLCMSTKGKYVVENPGTGVVTKWIHCKLVPEAVDVSLAEVEKSFGYPVNVIH